MTAPGLALQPALTGCHVLVVEDDYVIATDIADMLACAGAIAVGPVGREGDAMGVANDEQQRLDLAILDVDLHGIPSYRIADALIRRGVPIVFTTGFSANALAEAYRTYPRLEKPVSERALMQALMSLTRP